MSEEKELGMLYESFVVNEGLVASVGNIIRDGFSKGLDIFDIVSQNLPQFIAVAGILSSFNTMQMIHNMYQKHPEILKQHTEYADKAVKDIGQFLSDNPKILNIFLNKSTTIKETIETPEYFYSASCVDFEDGNEVQNITHWGEEEYNEKTYSHPSEFQISFKEFYRMTGKMVSRGFCGYNGGVVFWFDPKTDIHYFYTKTGKF